MELVVTVVAIAASVILAFFVSEAAWRRSRATVDSLAGVHAPTPYAASPDETRGAYKVVEATLAELPSAVQIDQDLELVAATLSRLGDALIAKAPPFGEWAQAVQAAAVHVGRLLPPNEPITPMLANPTLKVKQHFDNDLTTGLSRMRLAARQGDVSQMTTAVEAFRTSVERLETLATDWLSLRSLAATGFSRARAAEIEEIEKGWGWLAHAISSRFVDQSGQEVIWWTWDVLARPRLLDKLAMWLELETIGSGWSFDAICALSSTGLPLVTQLSTRLDKQVLVVDEKVFVFLPRPPNPTESVLLVDSGIQTGHHLTEVVQRVEDLRAEVAGTICICLNDLIPPNNRLPIIADRLERHRLRYLFTLSDLFDLWSGGRSSSSDERGLPPVTPP